MKTLLKNILLPIGMTAAAVFLLGQSAEGARIKDITNFEGIRTNPLIGYGLVVGLDGKGDKSGTEFTTQSLVNMLNRFGVRVNPSDVTVKNVAAVMITADLSPLSRPGSRLDVVVSSIGDAKSLQGGTLLFTPLKGADGEVYVVAQGAVSIGGFVGGGDDASVQKNHLTVGRISGGGLVEKPINLNLSDSLHIVLKKPDFTTSNSIAVKINSMFGAKVADPVDAAYIRLFLPDDFKTRPVEFFSMIEGLNVSVDTIAKVIVNERTGTIVVGENVTISTVAVAHGNITVEISTKYLISQPTPFGTGETVVQPEQKVEVKEDKARLIMIDGNTTLGDLVRGLNALGVTPRDLIAILQAIRASGALQADLEII
ncbi:MAG: flagellar basal body P-ring protein FlgI [Deltaproteobacteria bacterium]|nr:flagellar basal body P-ring protein FlgI [Deltaproteobacteria bacterium]